MRRVQVYYYWFACVQQNSCLNCHVSINTFVNHFKKLTNMLQKVLVVNYKADNVSNYYYRKTIVTKVDVEQLLILTDQVISTRCLVY